MTTPNVIIIHTDQQRYDSLGCTGSEYAQTPNLDRLAAEGSVFHRHFCAAPSCMPSRAALFTGLHPLANGTWTNGVPLPRKEYEPHYVRPNSTLHVCIEPMTIADYFALRGYTTRSLGKLHLTPTLSPSECGYPESHEFMTAAGFADWHGPYYGFQHVEFSKGHGVLPMRVGHYHHWLAERAPELFEREFGPDADPQRNSPAPGLCAPLDMPEELHHTSWIAEREIALIDEDRADGRPFFHFLGIADPHHPVAVPNEVLARFDGDVPPPSFPETDWVDGHPNGDRFQRAGERPPEALREFIRYTAAANALIDDAVGRIVSHLEERGLLENTIIVFTSDHGDFLGDHGLLMKSHSACTALLHTPLIIRGPGPGPGAGAGTPEAGADAAALPASTMATVSNMDVFPTLAHLSGGTVPEGLHGRDLVASTQSGEPGRAYAFSSAGPPYTLNQTVCDGRFRYTVYPHAGRVELYDHIEDRGDTRNLASDPGHRTDVERLGTELAAASLRHTVPILRRVSEW